MSRSSINGLDAFTQTTSPSWRPGASQADAVGALAAAAGFTAVLHKDLALRPRAFVLSI